MPMFIQGLSGLSRRMYDGGQQYAHASDILQWNEFMTISAFCLGAAQIPFIVNLVISLAAGKKSRAESLEFHYARVVCSLSTSSPCKF